MTGKSIKPSSVTSVKTLLEANKTALQTALPRHISVEKLIRVALTVLSTNPKLQECTQVSLIGAILQSALTGLEPDGVEAALVPFYNGRKKVYECQFQPMYQGLIKLSRQGERGTTLFYAEVVRENDEFSIVRGLRPDLIHVIPTKGERGGIIGVYAVFHLQDNGGVDFEYMTVEEVEKVRLISKAKDAGPWSQWWEEQAKKTVIKRLSKRAPKSSELKKAISIDNFNQDAA